MRTRLVTGSALFVALLVAGCGSDSSSSTTTMQALVTTSAPPTTVAPPVTTAAPVTAAPTTAAPTSTSTTTLTSSTTTSSSVPAGAALVLRDDGLGDALFGADADGVIDYITSVLGVPTDDSGWADPFEYFGICPGTEVRGVTWGDLQLLFSDESIITSGRRHFFNYVYGPASGSSIAPVGMQTADGIGVGATVGELRAAYPNVQIYPEEIYGPYFVVNDNLSGFLTGVTDADQVISFIGGIGCGE
jgi:hypothetical protein